MYIQKIYDSGKSREYEFCFAGRYGKKGEKRSKKRKASPEQIKKQNQWNRKKKLRRIIEYNFDEGDVLVTLKYKRGERPPMDEVVKEFNAFRTRMRRTYKKRGSDLKYVYRIEIGKRGGVHLHVLMNYTPDILRLVREYWKPGQANIETVYDVTSGEVADYLTKMPDGVIEGQMTLLDLKDQKKVIRCDHSRNLIIPEPEVKKFSRRTVERMIRDGIKPSEGHYIDKESIWYGINPFTGYTHLMYKEIRSSRKGASEKPKWKEEPPWL